MKRPPEMGSGGKTSALLVRPACKSRKLHAWTWSDVEVQASRGAVTTRNGPEREWSKKNSQLSS